MTGAGEAYKDRDKDRDKDKSVEAPGGGGFGPGAPVSELSYSGASEELDSIVEFFEGRDVDVDQLVARLERATAIVEELDRRIRRTSAQVEELVPRLDAVSRGTQLHDEGRHEDETDEADHEAEAVAEEDLDGEPGVWDDQDDAGTASESMPEGGSSRGQLPF
jgi:exonuclease VII small subunit